MKSESAQFSLEGLDISGEHQRVRKAYMAFSESDARILKELQPLVEKHVGRLVDLFYSNMERYPEAAVLIDRAGSSMDRLKRAQKQYWVEMFCGDYGDSYFQQRCRIGHVHTQIQLTPRWYIGGYSVYIQELIPLISRKYLFRPAKKKQAICALFKIIALDTQLAMDTYIHGLMNDLRGSKAHIESKVDAYSDFIHKVAGGNLNERISVEGDDALNVLGGRLNDMVERLSSITRQTQKTSDDIISNLDSVHMSINSQSSGAAQQAAAVNETTTTLAQIKATSTQTLDKAQRLGEISERSREESEQGMKAVEQCVIGMEAIREKVEGIAHTILALSDQTQQIGEITEVVTGLAQQLKMLALNASIEAAKAGEAGKGFGVVAAEVKDLAEQSQLSTAQVQKILQDIRHATDRAVMATEEGGKGVDRGVVLVEETGETMRNLSEVIKETNMASQQIMAAVRQEVTGIDQVNTAMGEINDVTNQFVDTSKDTKEATDDLQALAQHLKESVNVYKL